ncbi:tetratricopeptide repeat protein [uncultured Gemella sp.]|uniref:tetratricopeptide repeat protein n=1 Tax=uncultured Gemella sp. TaxID=254352 RepID=UPI0028D89A7C|nr:tetratricopeptide repeat protein [uncultured Gemella sp.]
MNDKKFWKIIYLYITKYNYSILYYRPEKKDVWLINEDNELIRFIYGDSFKSTEIDSIVSNVIRNEVRLKKMFKLSSLKMKILYVSPEFDEILDDYKKYRISNSLIIERILYNQKNSKLFLREKDEQFIEGTPDTLRYKNRVVELYKRQTLDRNLFNIKYNGLSIFYLILFLVNYLVVYLSNKNSSLYKYVEYSYQKIISGQFYRMFTSVFTVDNSMKLFMLIVTFFVTSILFNKSLNVLKSIGILFIVSFVFNLLLIFGYSGVLDIALVSNIAVLGSLFMEQLSKKNDNLKFMYSGAISIVYLATATLLFETSIVLYVFSFILGVFLELFLMKKKNMYIAFATILILSVIGEVLLFSGINTKSAVNRYRAGRVDNRLVKTYSDEDIFNLEKELTSKNKSVLTYYELGMVKMTTATKQDAKKVFLDGLNFDNTFAPIYYNLAVIERQEGNYSKAKEYAQKAYELDGREINRNLLEEMNKF